MGNKFYRLKESLTNSKVYIKAKQVISKNKFDDKAKQSLHNVADEAEKIRKNGFSKKQTIIISALLVICLIIVLWPTSRVESPLNAVSKIEQAIVAGDTKQAMSLVKFNNIAEEMSSSVLSQIKSKKLTNDLLSYMQKELENKIVADFYNIIKNKGDFYKNLEDENAVLSKTLNFLIGKSGSVLSREVLEVTDHSSIVRLVIFRADLEKEINVDLMFEYTDYGWVLTKVKDLDALLATLEEIEQQRIDKINKKIKENFNSFLVLKDFQKSDLDPKENSFLMRLSLENISKEDIQEVTGTLKIMHLGQLIGTIDIKIPDTIHAHNFYEKAWSIKLSDYKSLNSIAKASSKNIQADLEIEKIVFVKGNVLELVK